MRLIGLAVLLTVIVLLAPLAAEAQQAGKVWRIGFLASGPTLDNSTSKSVGRSASRTRLYSRPTNLDRIPICRR